MPGLVYKRSIDNGETELWSCCWIEKRNQENLFLYAGLNEQIKVSKLVDGELKEIQSINLPQSQAIFHLKKHPSRHLAVSTALNGQVNIWDIETFQKLFEHVASPCFTWAGFFSPNGFNLCVPSSTQAGGISIIDIEKKQEIICFNTKSQQITCVTISPDGKFVACCNPEGVVEVFDYSSSKLIYMMEGHAMPIRAITYSYDGNYLITGSQDSLIKIYDGRNSSFIGSLSGHTSWVTGLSFHPSSNNQFLSSSLDGTVKVWDTLNRSCMETLNNHQHGAWDVSYNKDGTMFGSVGESGDVCIYAA